MIVFMKVLLVQPNSATMRGILTPPLALLFIGEMAARAGHEVKIVDRNIDYLTKNLLKKFKPDVVGVSVFTGPLIKDAVAVSKFVRKEFSTKTKIVWGGIHPSLLPEQTVSNDFVDVVVVGEGEITFTELLDAFEKQKPLSDIEGIYYKENNKIKKTQSREFADLDKLPFINWNLINAKRYLDLEIVMVTSRGCPYNCYFCYNQEFNKRRWRAQSAQRVLEEIKQVERITDNRNLKFHDDNFTVDRNRAIRILNGLSHNYSLYIETRPEHVGTDLLEALKKFRKVWLFIGAESGSEDLLKSMNKMLTKDIIREAFRLVRSYKNIFTTASVILGLPDETYEDALQTISFAKSLKPTWVTYCIYTPYPGTYYYNDLVKRGLLKEPAMTSDWSYYTPDIRKLNSEFSYYPGMQIRELKKIDFYSWVKVIFNIILKGDIHKAYRFFKDKLMRMPLYFFRVLTLD